MDGRTWMKFDLSGSDTGKEQDQPGPRARPNRTPAAESTFLTGAKAVKKLGTEKVEGVEKPTMDTWIDGDDRTKQFRTRADQPYGRICLTAIRSRTLLQKPKTAGRYRALG
jgi:hypothetical protein